MQSCALRRRGASAYPLQAVTRDECRAYLVWQHCFSPVFITNLFSLSCRRGVGGRTIRAYSFYVTYCKHTNARTAQPAVCPPPMYKIMYNNSKAECVVGLLTPGCAPRLSVYLRDGNVLSGRSTRRGWVPRHAFSAMPLCGFPVRASLPSEPSPH